MNHLSKNIRFLRKARKLSQQQLADALDVKRSNIAAYETKGVEPRLTLINDMARFFGVSLAQLIVTDVSQQQSTDGTDPAELPADASLRSIDFTVNGQHGTFPEHAWRINQMLEGFRVFYEYKRAIGSQDSSGADIDNFLVFVRHMHAYNQQLLALLGESGPAGMDASPSSEQPQVHSRSKDRPGNQRQPSN